MDVLVTSKNKEEPNKNEGTSLATTLNIDFSKHSRADNSAVKGRIWSKFELNRDVTDVLVTLKDKEDPNIHVNEGARVTTTLNIDFSHSQGQITLQSRVGSG